MNCILGISGGIAAYKSADLASKLVGLGHSVRVVMTPSAVRFVGPLTFEGLTGHPVLLDANLRSSGEEGVSTMAHIDWARWCDVAILAPATASTIGKLTHGIADNVLLTLWLALRSEIPQLVCPAMNTAMWDHPAVKANLATLSQWPAIRIIAPVSKRLACGEVGEGALAEIDTILENLSS
jgi:phosphopantothenoylcysteine synthetase/decarboxylase